MAVIYRSRYMVPISSAPLEHGALLVEQGRITAVGSADVLQRRYPALPCHDFGDAIVLPAFINAHTHLELSHAPRWFAAAGEDVAASGGFTDWILRLIRAKIALKPRAQEYRAAWDVGWRQSLAAGTATVGDILSVPDLCAHSAAVLGGCSFVEIIGHDAVRVGQRLQQVDDCRDLRGHHCWGLAPHAPYTLSDELLRQCCRFAAVRHLRTTIHLAESEDEMQLLSAVDGPMAQRLYPFVGWEEYLPLRRCQRPLEMLERAGGLNDATTLVHGVHLNRSEIDRVAAAGCAVVLCPRSNAALKVGTAPAADYLNAGVTLALGTDSLASNATLSLWDEMEFALHWFSGDLCCATLLRMCTMDAATALYGAAADGLGSLAAGAPATFQVLRPDKLPQLDAIYPFLCQGARSAEVEQVFIGGDRCYLAPDAATEDEQESDR